jgi:hypothetical protein
LQEQFYRVDQFQSDIGGTVKMYAALLPDRASRTGVVPGWAPLDQKATELIVAYLELLDRFDPLEDSAPLQQQEAHRAFSDLAPKLGYLGNDMEGFLERFGPELQKVGQARERVESRILAANATVQEAEAAWRRMTDDGFQFDSADQAIARARIAGRKLTEAGPQLTPENVDEGAQVVEKLAAEARALATDLPRRAATLKNRIPSLATRIDALETRAASVPEAMRVLRREFSAGNWEDLGDREQHVEKLLAAAREQVQELRTLHERGDLTAALTALTAIETTLADAGALVDGPRERLSLLRQVRESPKQLFEKARFSLRDARYLLMDGKSVAAQPWAGRLDAAAAELISMESALDDKHPDYWALHQRIDALNARVRKLIDDFRAAH